MQRILLQVVKVDVACRRLFGVRRCGRCQAAILPSELVMRARELVFHVHCFTCAACGALLTKGDHFGMRDSAVFCRLHFELRCDAPPPPPPHQAPPFVPPPPHQHPTPFPSPEYHALPPPLQPPPPSAAAASGLDPKVGFFNGGGTTRQKGRPRKRKTKDLEHMTANLGKYAIVCVRINQCFLLLNLLLSKPFTIVPLFT